MAGQPGFFDADERLKVLSAAGEPLVRLAAVVDFELFRGELETALERSDRSKGGRPPYDAVLMFKALVLQTLYTLSDDATEYQLRDRLSFMRFCGLALHDPVPDAKTIWLYREQLTRAGAIDRLFERFDAILRERGFLAMGGRRCDGDRGTPAAARPRRERDDKGRRRAPDWNQARTRQIDRDGRWTLKRGRKRAPSDDGGLRRQATTEIVMPVFGYRTTSASTGRTASSAGPPSPTPPPTMVASSKPW